MLTLFAFAAAATARPELTKAATFPESAARALCQVYMKDDDKASFWSRADREFKLSPRQQVEVRLFCLGYQRGMLDQINSSWRDR